METKLNAKMKGELTRCIDCHMPGTANKGGTAGDFGRMIRTPPYANAADEENNAYWESSGNSHVFDVPLKTNVGVDGVPPGRGDACSVHGRLRDVPCGERVAVQVKGKHPMRAITGVMGASEKQWVGRCSKGGSKNGEGSLVCSHTGDADSVGPCDSGCGTG